MENETSLFVSLLSWDEIVTYLCFITVPGPPAHLVFIQTNASAGRVSWSAPSESNGKLRSYRIYYTPEEMAANQPLDKWAQVSSNQTTQEIFNLVLASYSITVKASTQVRYTAL